MKERDLYRAIGQIDDDLIEKAAHAGKKATVRPWIKWAGLAACFAIVVSAALMLPKLQEAQKEAPAMEDSEPAEAAADTAIGSVFNVASGNVDMGFDVMELSVTATEYQGSSISTDSGFVLTANGITEDMVREYVDIIPDVEYTLQTTSDGSILITPKSLEKNSIINLKLTDEEGNTLRKWAFQTADTFSVTSTYPAEGDMIYTDSGIEFSFSSDTVDITTVSDAFSIEPEVQGHFEKRGKTVIFVPKDGLEPGGEYTVTLDGSAADSDGTAIGEDISFSFIVDNSSGVSLFGYSEYELISTTPDSVLVIESPAGYDYTHLPIAVEVFAYGSFDAFTEDLLKSENSRNFTPDIDSMTPVMEFEAYQSVKADSVYSESCQIAFPDALEEGVYAVRYTMETEEGLTDSSYDFIQVSTLAVYAAASDDQILVWINDTLEDDVVSGAEVQVSSDGSNVSAVTGSSGSAIIDLPGAESGQSYLVKINAANRYYAAICHAGYDYGSAYAEDYYGYVYTSREIYMPTDTIRVWGYVAPRRDVALPDKVTVSFGYEEYGSYLGKVDARVSANGSFTCEFKLKDCGLYYLPIEVYINNEAIYSKSVEIGNYDKPIYIISAETDKEIYFADEISAVDITADVTFFDGTPAANMTLEYSPDWSGSGQTADCDINGKTEFSVSYHRGDNTSWNPRSANISVSTEELDSVATYCYLNPILFYHDIMLEAKADADGIDITANYIDLGGIDTEEELYAENYPENIRAGAYNCTVTITGVERYWQQSPAGTVYDYVYKKNVELYNYEFIENSLGPWEVELKDGKGSLEAVRLLEDRNYSFTITTTDSDGYTVSADAWYSGSLYGSVSAEEEINLHFVSGEDSYQTGFSENEKLTIGINNYELPFEGEEGGYFISFMQQESFYDETLREDTSFTLDFDEKNLPNANIIGAYYCGDQVYSISKLQLVFEPDERELSVDIITDGDTFAPGGEADVTVRVTDSSGKAVSGAEVLISVSDEAVFAVKEQSADFLTSLYSYRSWGYISVYGGMGDMMAEMGGGAPMEYRREFVDDLSFDCLVTNERGEVRTTLKLADNLTSWRVTALAASGKNVGDGKANFEVSLPAFLSPTFSDTFIYGDDVSFGCRTYGCEVEPSDEAEYTAAVMDENGNEVDIITATNLAGDNASFNFGKLEHGSYTLLLSVEAAGHSDAVQLPFEVVSTAAELWVTRQVDAQQANDLEPAKYPISFTVTNAAYKTYNRVLNTVNFSGSVRNDEIAAKNLAGEIMAEFTGDESFADDLPSLNPLREKYGLLSELDAGSGSAYFSARLAAAVPEYVNREQLIARFEDILQNTDASSEEVTSAYLGLAALEQPVLTEVRSLITEAGSALDDTDMLRLAYALALMGDFDSSYQIYSLYVTPILEALELDEERSMLRCSLGGIEEKNVEYTALALAAASVMELEETEQLAEYLIYAKQSLSHTEYTEFYPLCELMTYLRHYTPRSGSSEQVTVSYMKDGIKVTETVSRRGMAVISFSSEEEYSKANITVSSGDACIIASFMADIQEVSEQKSPCLTVEKQLSSSGHGAPMLVEADSFAKLGEDVVVTITVTCDEPGVVYIQDHIPTGFRMADSAAYVDGQTVRFYKEVTAGSVTVSYRIKPVVSGSFVVEMPIAARIDNGTLVTGERSTVEVAK